METLHASCVLIGEAGILIRGPSGSGKSTLAHDLVGLAATSGHFARFVADDRVRVAAHHGRVVARPVPAIAGRAEIRGGGIVRVPYEPAAVVRLVVDCTREEPPRLPTPAEGRTEIAGVELPRMVQPIWASATRVLWRICAADDTIVIVP